MFQVIVAWDCIGYRGKMGGWGGGGGVGRGVYLPGILTFHKFEIFYNHGWIYRFQREFNKNYEERWSPNNFMQSLSVHCFLMSKKVFLYTFNPRLLNSFDLPSYGSELRKRYTLRLFLMCLEEKSFGSCSAWGNGDKRLTWGERYVWWASSKMILKSPLTIHVHFRLPVSWTLCIELNYKKCIFLNMSAKVS